MKTLKVEKVELGDLFIDEAHDMIGLVKHSYNWNEHFPYIKMTSGPIENTDIYKGKEGDQHFVVRNVVLEIRDDVPPFLYSELQRILSKYSVKSQKIE